MTTYPRTIRYLNADTARPWLIALGFAVLLMLLWVIWFFFAQITFTVQSESAHLYEGNIIVADFSQQALQKIARGQSAFVYVDDHVGQPEMIAAIVSEVNREEQEVQLIVQSGSLKEENLTGKVEVEVEHLSPARIVLRAAGLTGS